VEPAFHLAARDDRLAITWLGHATAVLEVGPVRVLTDPMWSERASPLSFAGPKRWVAPPIALEALPPIDLVLLSHNHYDHLDVPTVRRFARLQPAARWLVPLGLRAFVERLGVPMVEECGWWDERRVGPARVVCTPAQHFSARGPGDRNTTLWCGWTVAAGTRRVFFAGDTGYHPEFGEIARRLGPFDAVLLPVGAYAPRWFMRPVHMDPDDAVAAYADLAGANGAARPAMVPIHWGTFKLTDEPMDEPPQRAREAWRRAGLAEADLWLLRHGETRQR
jgi:N-acyl-phosphatidylethanolamine-hydrolysing phospholipase D